MGAAENHAQEYEDKVPEEKMAELLGITKRALGAKRGRGQIPLGVWNKINAGLFTADGSMTNGSRTNGFTHRSGNFPQITPNSLHLER
ncbi:hypothetical protein [Pseudomonas fluorescens]|uniref:hypothetical protein n=1 Tax=Pseudomonas fluorescens TaxID=294 RepID=UPI00138DE25F|nr:hypothetical protein [Pseudomonas fluorescens]